MADDTLQEALVGARRMYDRQVSTLENIDDVAMRTVRTAVLLLGFVASALTVAGPAALAGISPFSAAFATMGVLALFGAAFVGVGTFSVTRYRLELTHGHLSAAETLPYNEWAQSALIELETAIGDLNEQIEQNSEYVEIAQGLMLFGSLSLLYATGLVIVHRSYGIAPWKQVAGVVLALAALLLAVRVLVPHEEWSTQ